MIFYVYIFENGQSKYSKDAPTDQDKAAAEDLVLTILKIESVKPIMEWYEGDWVDVEKAVLNDDENGTFHL